jgi:hypothetical protein
MIKEAKLLSANWGSSLIHNVSDSSSLFDSQPLLHYTSFFIAYTILCPEKELKAIEQCSTNILNQDKNYDVIN